jgi:hypothetical protein
MVSLSKICPVDFTSFISLLMPVVLGIVTPGRCSETYFYEGE